MRFLRSNTAVIVTVGPFYDKTDGVTIETALTITNERITLTADTDAGSAPTNILDNVTGATSGTSNDLNYITGNDAGMMQLELAAADTNRVGRMLLSITDAANHVPVFHEFFVLPQAIYDWFTGVIVPLPANVTQLLGTAWLTPAVAGTPDVNMKQISGDATAADNLETAFDDTAGAVPWMGISHQGTLQSVTSTTIVVLAASASAEDDVYNGHTFQVVSATTGAKQSVIASDYVGSTKTLTLSTALNVALTGTVVYKLWSTGRAASAGSGATAQEVWEYSTRTLTALDEDNTTLDLDATIRSAVGLASANLDTQLSTIDDFLDTEVAAIKTKTDFLPSATAGAAGGLFIAGTNAATSITTALTANITGNLSGSVGSVTGAVGSVTGAVGSVTGNVGGNVVGSVASVTAGVTLANNAITAAATAADFTTEVTAGLATSAAVSTLQTSVDDLPTNAELATALGTADDAVLAQIALVKAKTDSLTFTTANMVDAAIKRVGSTTLTGSGTGGQGYGG